MSRNVDLDDPRSAPTPTSSRPPYRQGLGRSENLRMHDDDRDRTHSRSSRHRGETKGGG